MELVDWCRKWERGEIGFHQAQINPKLEKFFSSFDIEKGSKILVPLCGKSLDLLYSPFNDHQVKGIEISPLAVQAFLSENGFLEQPEELGEFRRFPFHHHEIVQGDFFKTPIHKEHFEYDFLYDRACLVALNPDQRKKYCKVLIDLARPKAKVLLVSFEYDESKIDGPPFSVVEKEIRNHFEEVFQVECLESVQEEAKNPRFVEKGVFHFTTKTYSLTKRS